MTDTLDRLQGARSTLGMKTPVRVATTANITLSGLQAIDGITVAEDDRVLVKDQNDETENGPYAASSGEWARTKDFDGSGDFVQGTLVPVAAGTANVGTIWRVSSAAIDTIGEDDITFAQLDFTSVEVSADIATGASINLNSTDAEIINVTGSGATITSITLADGKTKIVRFEGANTLTHSSSLVLPGALNITTAAGDFAIFCGYASSVVRCAVYQRAAVRVHADTTQNATSATAESDLSSYSLPAGRLASSGAGVRIRAWGTGTTASTAATRRVRLYFGATVIADSGAQNVPITWHLEGTVLRTSAAGTQEAFGQILASTGNFGDVVYSRTSPAETLSGAVTIKVTGLCTASTGILTQSGFVVEQLSL